MRDLLMPRSADSLPRRELLRIGALSLFGAAGNASVRGWSASAAESSAQTTAHANERRCIFILLQGGPSHLDLWDLKPQAPAEIRGPFQPIDTTVGGLQIGELLPRTATVAQHLALVRSVEHRFANHIAGTYITLTGSNDQPDQDREAHGDDFPGPGAVLNYLERSPGRVPASVSLPNWLSIPGPSNRMPGQYGGFLGSVRDPFLISGEPQQADFKPLSLSLPEGFTLGRMESRWSLLGELERATRRLEDAAIATHDRLCQSAYELLVDPRVREALDLSREPQESRERYGMSKIGQSLLLARRLSEAGVPLVAYNAFNQEWDTHGGLEGRYNDLVPRMDQAFAALVDDLAQRGLLDQTLVINTGEFGRTPVINGDAGRDHWPHAYTTVLAGGGIRGGQVFGASDPRGAYVAGHAVSPADILATMWHVLGIDPQTELRDRLHRPIALSRGRVIHELL